jgi:hypothetical protein
MNDTPSAYPLHWPTGYPRTPPGQCRNGVFKSGEQAFSGSSSAAAVDNGSLP